MATDSANEHASAPPSDEPRRRRRASAVVATLLLLTAAGWAHNYFGVERPVNVALGSDPRNDGFSIAARYRFYLDRSTLVLDLRQASAIAPIDLFRGVFQSAAAMAERERVFDRVVLARAGAPVFVLKGEDFRELGREFAAGQNPVYLVRTFPEKLYKPSGEPAYGHWQGGLIGVLGKQMDDANEAARTWAGAE